MILIPFAEQGKTHRPEALRGEDQESSVLTQGGKSAGGCCELLLAEVIGIEALLDIRLYAGHAYVKGDH